MATINPTWTRADRINVAKLNLGVGNIAVQVNPIGGDAVEVTVTGSAHNQAVTTTAVADAFAAVNLIVTTIVHINR